MEVENRDTASPSDVDVLWKWRTGMLLLLQMSMSYGSGEQGCCFSFRCRCLVELENRDAACSSDTLGVVHTTYEFKVMVPICLWLIQYLACCLKFVRAKLIPCAAVDVSGCTNLLIILHYYVCWLLQSKEVILRGDVRIDKRNEREVARMQWALADKVTAWLFFIRTLSKKEFNSFCSILMPSNSLIF